jgi:tRNA nucleotidyltransferase (CCA-adding enzyme)
MDINLILNDLSKYFEVFNNKVYGNANEIARYLNKYGDVINMTGHQGFDVTSDHALPIEKDLERRDFTINAIARDVSGNIVDPYGGQEDLKNKIIRVVNPEAFSDDPLRMLRAIQFASRFNFTIEPKTMQMIQNNASRIKEIPPERILTEFDKIVKKGNPLIGAQLLIETELFQQIFGKPKKISDLFAKVKTMGEFIYLLSKGTVADPAAFYKNILKGDIDTFKEIKAIDIAYNSNENSNPIKAKAVAHNMYVLSPQSLQSQILPDIIKTAAQELLSGKYPKTIGELAINGNDLMTIGLKGKEVGNMLKSLLLNIYANKINNNKEELLNFAEENKKADEINASGISYSGVILDEESKERLIKVFKPMIPKNWEIIAHHMTIKMDELDPNSIEKKDMETGKIIQLNVVDYAMNDMVMAVGVEGYMSYNKKPHITLAINKEVGGKPAMSHELTDWKPLGFPLKLTGKIEEIEQIEKIDTE